MVRSKEVPDCRKEQGCGSRYEAKEKDDDKRVFVVHEVVAQTGARICNAAIGESEVESSECRGDVDEDEAVKEAYGSVSSAVSYCHVKFRHVRT